MKSHVEHYRKIKSTTENTLASARRCGWVLATLVETPHPHLCV